MTSLGSGLIAGAAGTAALFVTTYADMAVRGRPASDTPEQTVSALLDRYGLDLPGTGGEQANRLTALGALSGLATGIGVGGAVGLLRGAGLRLGRVTGTVVVGGAAMAVTDASMAALGVSDPAQWSASDWVADAIPHLVFGYVTTAALAATDRPRPARRYRRRRPVSRAGLLVRSALVGAATGGRSSAGLAALAATASPAPGSAGHAPLPTAARAGAGLLAVGELVADKLPGTPARTEPQGAIPRIGLGGVASGVLARRAGRSPVLPALVGGAAAAGTTLAGFWWRDTFAPGLGWSPLTAALVEDAAVVALAAVAIAGS
jgi:uncharacterized membrane protein